MKRLFYISGNLIQFSLCPIIGWFLISLFVDKNLLNIFTIIYPLQFINLLIKSVFSTSPNIAKNMNKDETCVYNGILFGIVIGAIIYSFIIFNIENYFSHMNISDVSLYKNYVIFGIIQIYLSLVFSFILEKKYYEGLDKEANLLSCKYNILSITLLLLSLIVFKNSIFIISFTLIPIFMYCLYNLIKEFKIVKLNFYFLTYIKYDLVDFINSVFFFCIFFFGLSNATAFGTEYIIAINFVALITDTQWDAFEAISTVAKIDLSKGEFDYKKGFINLERRKSI